MALKRTQYAVTLALTISELNQRRQEHNVDFSSKTKDQMALTSHQEDCFQAFSNLQLNSAEGIPHMDLLNVKLVCSTLTPHTSVLEWGCGYSTTFFSRYVKKWVCIEHVPEWGQIITEKLKNSTFRDKVSVNVIECNNPNFDNTFPAIFFHDGDYQEFRDYIEFGRSLNEKFDVIIDDGRARVHVALSVLRNKLLKKSGVVILHDWEREHYKPVLDNGFTLVKEDTISGRHLAILKPTKY